MGSGKMSEAAGCQPAQRALADPALHEDKKVASRMTLGYAYLALPGPERAPPSDMEGSLGR